MMRNPFDPFADFRHLLEPMQEMQRQIDSMRVPDMTAEIEKQMSAHRAAIDSVADHYSKLDLGSIGLKPVENALSQLDLVRDSSRLLAARSQDLLDIAAAAAEASDWASRIKLPSLEIPDLSPALSNAFKLGMYPPFPSLVATAELAAQSLADTISGAGTFAATFAQQAARILQADTEEELDEALRVVEAELESRLPAARKDRISFEAWLSIVLTLLLFIASKVDQTKSERRILERLSAFEAEVLSLLEPPDQLKAGRHVEATSAIDVRAEPRHESGHRGFLFPGRSVRVLSEETGGWVEVEFFNDIDGALSIGWVEKSHLRESDEATNVP